MKTIKIKIANYDRETPELRQKFKEMGLQSFDSLHFQYSKIKAGTYHVELNTVFSNQYNTTEGFRIFEKCACLQDRTLKPLSGYYISEGIDKIREYQKDLRSCGYCGKQYYKSGGDFCEKCLDSEYLKESELNLLRLHNIRYKRKYAPLTDKEASKIVPKYNEAQGLGKSKRKKAELSKNRQRVANLIPKAKEKAQQAIEEAKIETEAFTWLLDNELNILDNVIYYSHTKRFGFGWRDSLSDENKSKLLDVLCEFPFDYDIK